MKVFGLTGGIASGKSTVARFARELGYWVLDADQVAREVVAPQSEGLAAVVERFGASILDPDGRLDRKKLGQHIFNDERERLALNAILHPRIAARSAALLQAHAETGAACAIYEVPLLFENRLQAHFTATLLVAIPPALQLQRLCERDHLSPHEAQARLLAQMPLDQKRQLADYIIENNGSLDDLRKQTHALRDLICHATPKEEASPASRPKA
jgi:dephospho-CoA kinase